MRNLFVLGCCFILTIYLTNATQTLTNVRTMYDSEVRINGSLKLMPERVIVLTAHHDLPAVLQNAPGLIAIKTRQGFYAHFPYLNGDLYDVWRILQDLKGELHFANITLVGYGPRGSTQALQISALPNVSTFVKRLVLVAPDFSTLEVQSRPEFDRHLRNLGEKLNCCHRQDIQLVAQCIADNKKAAYVADQMNIPWNPVVDDRLVFGDVPQLSPNLHVAVLYQPHASCPGGASMECQPWLAVVQVLEQHLGHPILVKELSALEQFIYGDSGKWDTMPRQGLRDSFPLYRLPSSRSSLLEGEEKKIEGAEPDWFLRALFIQQLMDQRKPPFPLSSPSPFFPMQSTIPSGSLVPVQLQHNVEQSSPTREDEYGDIGREERERWRIRELERMAEAKASEKMQQHQPMRSEEHLMPKKVVKKVVIVRHPPSMSPIQSLMGSPQFPFPPTPFPGQQGGPAPLVDMMTSMVNDLQEELTRTRRECEITRHQQHERERLEAERKTMSSQELAQEQQCQSQLAYDQLQHQQRQHRQHYEQLQMQHAATMMWHDQQFQQLHGELSQLKSKIAGKDKRTRNKKARMSHHDEQHYRYDDEDYEREVQGERLYNFPEDSPDYQHQHHHRHEKEKEREKEEMEMEIDRSKLLSELHMLHKRIRQLQQQIATPVYSEVPSQFPIQRQRRVICPNAIPIVKQVHHHHHHVHNKEYELKPSPEAELVPPQVISEIVNERIPPLPPVPPQVTLPYSSEEEQLLPSVVDVPEVQYGNEPQPFIPQSPEPYQLEFPTSIQPSPLPAQVQQPLQELQLPTPQALPQQLNQQQQIEQQEVQPSQPQQLETGKCQGTVITLTGFPAAVSSSSSSSLHPRTHRRRRHHPSFPGEEIKIYVDEGKRSPIY